MQEATQVYFEDLPDYLGVGLAARLLGMTRMQVCREVVRGELPGLNLPRAGRRVAVEKEAVLRRLRMANGSVNNTKGR